MKKFRFVSMMLFILLAVTGCDIPWKAVGSIASGDLGPVLNLFEGDHENDSGQKWYCWPACSWFD